MAHERTDSYVNDSTSLFQYYKKLGENAIAQCPDSGLVAQVDPESNSIVMIVKHLAGNLRLVWSEFLITDGDMPSLNSYTAFECPPKTLCQIVGWWLG